MKAARAALGVLLLSPLLILAIPEEASATAYCSTASQTGVCLHWNRPTAYNVAVTFADFTGSSWPVSTATYKWDEARRVQVLYRYKACASQHCVPVKETYYENVSWAGVTFWQYDQASGHFKDGSVSVWMNNWWVQYMGYSARWHATCHELGHALGLAHNWPAGQGSCMSTPADGSGEWPLPEDFWMLDNVMYNH